MLIIAKWTKLVWNYAEDIHRAQERHAADELCNEATYWMLLPPVRGVGGGGGLAGM